MHAHPTLQIFKYSDYDMLLATGPFRMLRIRNLLKSLDSAREGTRQGNDGTGSNQSHRKDFSFGPLVVSSKVCGGGCKQVGAYMCVCLLR